jgi:hypothetical protein
MPPLRVMLVVAHPRRHEVVFELVHKGRYRRLIDQHAIGLRRKTAREIPVFVLEPME